MAAIDSITNAIESWSLRFISGIVEAIGYPLAALALVRGAAQVEAQTDLNQIRSQYQAIPLDPAMLSEMVMRGIVTEDDGAAEAGMSALNKERFDKLVATVGEPPGIMQMLSLYRRGLIDDEALNKIIRYSRVRNEWIPQIKMLAHDTMSQSEALEGAVKGVLDPALAKELFIKAGGLEDQFQTLLDTSGNAIGVEQVEHLWLHGLATSEDVHKTILHSRINPLFEGLAAKLYHRYLTGFQIKTIVQQGGATPAQAVTWLTEQGYPADQAAAFVKAVAQSTAGKVHDITEGQVLELYQSHFITVEAAKRLLTHLGYPPEVQTYLLEILDAKRSLAALNQAVTYVRKSYIAGRTDDNKAQQELGALEVPNAAVQAYLAAWKIEKASEFKTLTAAQVGTAMKKGYITEADALNRWGAMGYDSTDSAILAAEHGGAMPPGSTAAPGK